MSMITQTTVEAPVLKIVTAWAAVGIASWSDVQAMAGAVAAILASIYSALLIGEWVYKKLKKNTL